MTQFAFRENTHTQRHTGLEEVWKDPTKSVIVTTSGEGRENSL